MNMIKTLLVLAFVFAGAGIASAQVNNGYLDNEDSRQYDQVKEAAITNGKTQNMDAAEVAKAQALDQKYTAAAKNSGLPGVQGFTYNVDLTFKANEANWQAAVEDFKRNDYAGYVKWWNSVNGN
jgi:hypothetical protein